MVSGELATLAAATPPVYGRIMKFVAAVLAVLALLGCKSRMEVRECDALRTQAFDLLNTGHTCSTDADCRLSEWPGCEKAISQSDFQTIAAIRAKVTAGQCEEPKKPACRVPPPSYCKQGLCSLREKGIETEADIRLGE